MLKKIRVILALIIFSLFTFYFLDFAGILPWQFHSIGHIQFVPALISGSLGILAFLVIFTLLFGRIYCSIICPMGIFQDIIIRLRKKRFVHRHNHLVLRISILTITIIFFIAGFTIVVGLLDPYSAYGRMAVHLFKPIYLAANNILASIFNYTFYKMEIAIPSLFAFIVAVITFIIITVMAFTNGRLYCNTICPVGTILGILNKFSFFKIRIDSEKCVSCGMCAKGCKAQCIDLKHKTIDYSRCVNCFNCLGSCKKSGISFSRSNPLWLPFFNKEHKSHFSITDTKKRDFLKAGLITVAALPVAALAKNSPLSAVRSTAISPPGSRSTEHLKQNCTSCHLCISKCPTSVLKPAFMQYGAEGMMMPVMYFEKGFCNYDCVECTKVCPNGALETLTVEEKHLTQVGKVIFKKELCVPITEGTSCGACAEHCPTQAVRMIPFKDGLTIPEINQDICVGCGGCEFICPVRPQRAIFVQGNPIHQKAKPFIIEKVEEKEVTDFGF